MQKNWNVQFNSNNKIVKEWIWIVVKWTIQDRVVKVDVSNARSRAYSRSSRRHVQNVREVKTWTAAEMVENEPFMCNKLVAGRDAKVRIWTDLNLWTLSSGTIEDVRCITVQAKSVEIHVRTFDPGGVFVKACPMLTRARMQQLQQLHQSQQLKQPECWRFVLDTILPGYQWAPQWVPVRTPTVHWGPISGKAVGGPLTV